MMSLPVKPMIGEAQLIRHKGQLNGPIELGEVFAWEPDHSNAREFCIVSRIIDRFDNEREIWTWNLDYTRECCNDESRFREAAVRTRFRLFPISPGCQYGLSMPSEMEAALRVNRKISSSGENLNGR